MPLNDVIAKFATANGGSGTYTVRRTAAGSYVLGRHVAGSETTFPIVAVVVPMGGRLLDAPATGEETSETMQLATTTRLVTRQESNAPDIVIIKNDAGDDEEWLCTKWARSEHWGAAHYVIDVERQEVP